MLGGTRRRTAAAVLAAAAAAVLALGACGGRPGQPLLAEIQARGRLVVGTSADYPPFEYVEDGRIVGFDVDLIGEVARDLGVGVQLVNLPFDGLLGAVVEREVDVVIAGMAITPDRQRAVAFSDPYFASGTRILVHEATTGVDSLDDLAGKRVATQAGSAQEAVARAVEGAVVETFPLETDAAVAVAAGRADALLVGGVVARVLARLNPELKIVGEEIDPVPLGIGLRKDEPELLAAVNASLARMRVDGRYDRLVETWFGGNR